MTNKNAKEITHSWISSKLNPVEEKNIWQNQDQSNEI